MLSGNAGSARPANVPTPPRTFVRQRHRVWYSDRTASPDVETKRHTTLSHRFRRESSQRPHEKEFLFVRTRQDAGLRRLQPGVRVLGERAAVLLRPAVQRTASMPIVPRSQEGRARRKRRRKLLRRRLLRWRLLERPARDV